MSMFSRRRFFSTAGLAGITVTGAGLVPGGVRAGEAGGGFSVPENERGLTFVFQGDSITDGNWGRNLKDLNHHLGHGYVFAIASRLGADFPRAGFGFHNRGVGGQGVSGLEKRWERDALALKPDVLSILIGVNDVMAIARKRSDAADVATYTAVYRRLLKRSRDANPNLILVLGLPFLYRVGGYGKLLDAAGGEMPRHVDAVRELAREFNAVLVDYPAMFERAAKEAPMRHWIWDGCHPTVFGHELMAREWIRRLGGRLRFLKAYKCLF
ncbi:MAG: SGNH/GDSL hydrolase family protein [Puniceicoccales bacterium]|jgi:lysophospholipase L1-like esterase|nr:SGNH/GDSL hydrolase family protein [Puniceicoccales bacterium]